MESGWSWTPNEAGARALASIDPNTASSAKTPANNKPTARAGAAPGNGDAAPSRAKAAAPKPAAAASSSSTRKRKADAPGPSGRERLFPADAPEIGDDDPRLGELTDTCNGVRKKIRAWTDSGAMKVGEFQAALGVSSKAYLSFMNRTGAWDGEGCDTYAKAHVFFKKRELQGLPLSAGTTAAAAKKRAKTSSSGAGAAAGGGGEKARVEAVLDVGGVALPGEDEGNVPVYETCDSMRTKIRAFLKKEGMTQAALLRAISKCLPGEPKLQSNTLTRFMGYHGPLAGNTSSLFYGAYVFFEKLRIKEDKPKSKFREEMEKAHGREGLDLVHGQNSYITLHETERAYYDKYGKLQIEKVRPGPAW